MSSWALLRIRKWVWAVAAPALVFCCSCPAPAQLAIPEDVEIRKPGDSAPPHDAERPKADGAQAPPSGDSWSVDLPNGQRLELVRVPAGEFLMGSPDGEPDRSGDEHQHRIRIQRPFWMGKHEVTQAQWRSVMGNNPSESRGDELPVEMVSWNDCVQFLENLNAATGGAFRLPMEAEWEHACRAGSETAWCCGDAADCLESHAWFLGNSGGAPHPVGTMRPNGFGLHDMHGNVYEWCADRYVRRHGAAAADGEDPMTHVRRGGSWSVPPKHCRSAFRGNASSEKRRNDAGLRVVMDAEPSSSVRQGLASAKGAPPERLIYDPVELITNEAPPEIEQWAGLFQRAVYREWTLPSDIPMSDASFMPEIMVTVARDGRIIGGPVPIKMSPNAELNESCIRAVLNATLPPFPENVALDEVALLVRFIPQARAKAPGV